MTVKIEILTDSKATIVFLKQVYVKPYICPVPA